MIRKRHKSKQELASGRPGRHRKAFGAHGDPNGVVIPRANRIGRYLRYAFAGLFVTVVVMVIGAAFLYFAVQGRSGEGGAFKERFEAGLQELVGPDYSVSVQATDVAFNLPAIVSVRAEGIELSRANGEPLVQIGALDLATQTASIFSGALRFTDIEIDELRLDTGSGDSGLAGIGAPKFISERLALIGVELARIQNRFDNGLLNSVVVNSLVIETGPGSTETAVGNASRLVTGRLALTHNNSGRSNATAELVFGDESVLLDANYALKRDGSASLKIDALGIETASWFPAIESSEGAIAFDSTWAVDANIPFDRTGEPQQPLIRLYSIGGKVRLGASPPSSLETAEINLRFIPDREQVELERSSIAIEGMDLRLIGGLKPKYANEGFHGPLEYELIVERAEGKPTMAGETPALAAMSVGGFFEPETTELEISNWFIAEESGRVGGTGLIDFSAKSPAISVDFAGENLSVGLVKQFWPVFIARPAREWVREHVAGGMVGSVNGKVAIPTGIIGNINKGARFAPDHFQLNARIDGSRIDTFGKLPPLEDTRFDLAISGMEIRVALEQAALELAGAGTVNVSGGEMQITDFSDRPAIADFKLALDGEAQAVFKTASLEPLNLSERTGLDASGFTGKTHVDVVASLPLLDDVPLKEVRWNALAELTGFSSSQPLFERMITDGNMVLDITAEGARINGSAKIDGVSAELAVVEPFGTGSSLVKKRDIALVVDEAQRKKLGIDLSGYVKGPMAVRVSDGRNGGEHYDIDLTRTELSIAAAGWQKGAGIPGKASFTRIEKDGVNTLQDFAISGGGLSASGTVGFDGKGLLSAVLKNVALNNGDAAELTLSRSDGIYRVNITGNQWDARGVINKLFHLGGFKEEQGGVSVNLQANLGKVIGFQNRHLANTLLTYKIREGSLRALDLKGALDGNRGLAVNAQKDGTLTRFDVSAGNAGSAFAFADIYRRMEGGALEARLTREGSNGAFIGPIVVSDFTVVDEPRLEKLVSSRSLQEVGAERREFGQRLQEITTKRANFIDSKAIIEKGDGYFRITDGVIRGAQLGFVFDGTLYDPNDRMDMRGTFMPAFGLSMAVSAIPFVGELLSNGRDGGLIGITYKLSGPASNPTLQVNPISLVAPGVFNKVFEFRN